MKKLPTTKERILKERGLTINKPHKTARHKFHPAIKAPVSAIRKTPLMRYLEEKYKCKIEEVLVSGSLNVVANQLGNEVDKTTVSKWIKKFRLRYTADNLPNCDGCKQYGPACESGVCYVLMALELYELVPIKRKEMFDEGNPATNEGA